MGDQPPSRRDRQAQQTRDEILHASRRLFADRGYARTSVRDIAAAAGVSSQTVYDSVGSKRALVAHLNDLIDDEAGIVAIAIAAAQSTDPVTVVETSARITRSILENCADIVRALVSGAAAEPDLTVALNEGHRRHRAGAARVVGRLQQLDALDEHLGAEEAGDTLAAITDVQFALVLRDTHGWTVERVDQWMRDTSRALLLK